MVFCSVESVGEGSGVGLVATGFPWAEVRALAGVTLGAAGGDETWAPFGGVGCSGRRDSCDGDEEKGELFVAVEGAGAFSFSFALLGDGLGRVSPESMVLGLLSVGSLVIEVSMIAVWVIKLAAFGAAVVGLVAAALAAVLAYVALVALAGLCDPSAAAIASSLCASSSIVAISSASVLLSSKTISYENRARFG